MLRPSPPPSRPLLSHLIRFSRALRDAGVKVNPAGTVELCRSFNFIDIGDRLCFYAAARATMISRCEDLPGFDRVFHEFWISGVEAAPAAGRPDTEQRDEPRNAPADTESATRSEEKRYADAGDDDAGGERVHAPEPVSYSDHALLVQKDIGRMSASELEQAREVVHELVKVLANYRSRRLTAGRRRDLIDFRRVFRRNTPYGGLPLRLCFRKHREKKTRLVLLCDVSGSMERYSRFLIQFICALRQVLPQVDIGVFSTRLTMVTDLLDEPNVDASLQRVLAGVGDWGSGTDIGGSLGEFNRQFARHIVRNRTLVVILSDGWDRGDADV
ncbi:MAG: VWA domain-containing protein, partial [Gammaproteobacteria bacterium]|nr:VWA domain-containing protein [Gammaproteobacteria bacterium]